MHKPSACPWFWPPCLQRPSTELSEGTLRKGSCIVSGRGQTSRGWLFARHPAPCQLSWLQSFNGVSLGQWRLLCAVCCFSFAPAVFAPEISVYLPICFLTFKSAASASGSPHLCVCDDFNSVQNPVLAIIFLDMLKLTSQFSGFCFCH